MPELTELVKEHGTTFVLATFVDLHGKPCAKLVPASAVDRLAADGVGFAGFAAGAIGQRPSDPDIMAMPDAGSFTPLPFIRPGLAMVHCDPHVEGEPWPFAPRLILRAALARLAATGHSARLGAEAEYFLVRRDAGTGALSAADSLDTADSPCYDALGLTRMFDHLAEVSTAVNGLGWDNYANDHEDGNGQFEQNFTHADPLTTADRVITFRYIVHMLARRRDMTATFMPKPFAGRTGTGLHLHVSLWDSATGGDSGPGGGGPGGGDTPAFPATAADPRGLGLSPLAYSFIGGVLAHAPAMVALTCPTVNSYKRLHAPAPASGATWSPAGATYGGNDRTHFVRVPEGDRVEVRGVDGSANPYLAAAAVLTAGLDGVATGADPGPVGARDGAVSLPPTLLHAADALAADPVLLAALDGATGTGPGPACVADYYVGLKRAEFLAWHGQVSSWEVERYLTAF
jgi:glutamine synthetase